MKNNLRSKPLNERIWLSVGLSLFLYVIILYSPQIIMSSLHVEAPLDDLINLVIYSAFWFLLIPFGLHLPGKVRSLKEYFSNIQLSNTKPIGLKIMLGVGAGGLYLLILASTSSIFGSIAPNIGSILPPGNWVLLYGNIGAFFEEVAIRGVILILLLKRYDKTRAVFFSALIFGVGHILTYLLGNQLFFSLVQVVYAFAFGVLFAALVIKTKSLIAAVITHMLINSFTGLFSHGLEPVELAYLLLISSVLTTIIGLFILKYIPGSDPIAAT